MASASPGSPPPADAPPRAPAASPGRRIEVIDWLRGLAVVLMIQAHGFDAWLRPDERTGAAWWFIRHMSGLPSRLFLLLVGVSAAIRFESQLARGVPSGEMRAQALRRGLEIVGLAYLFRLQEHVLAGFYGGWQMVFRVDILNAIGMSMLVLAAVSVPRAGRRQVAASLLVAAVLVGLGPVVGPAQFPAWLPRPLTSYVGGQRPMSWFPLFPWGAWALVGVAIGHLWVRQSGDAVRQARCFLLTGVAGLACIGAVALVRAAWPHVIRYPTAVVQQMGPGAFFHRLGIIGILAAVGWVITRLGRDRFSPLRQLGQTSLLIYWIHVDLCYGFVAWPLQKKLRLVPATLGVVLLIAAMLAVSVVRTRYGGRIARSIVARWRALRARAAQD